MWATHRHARHPAWRGIGLLESWRPSHATSLRRGWGAAQRTRAWPDLLFTTQQAGRATGKIIRACPIAPHAMPTRAPQVSPPHVARRGCNNQPPTRSASYCAVCSAMACSPSASSYAEPDRLHSGFRAIIDTGHACTATAQASRQHGQTGRRFCLQTQDCGSARARCRVSMRRSARSRAFV